jgi:hypothetical protein
LPQHGVYQRGLTVVNMGNDGDIAYRLGHREFSFLFGSPCSGRGTIGLGAPRRRIATQCGFFYSISDSGRPAQSVRLRRRNWQRRTERTAFVCA